MVVRLLALILILPLNSEAQLIYLKRMDSLLKLEKQAEGIQLHTNYKKIALDELEEPFLGPENTFSQNFAKTSDGLVFNYNGTGLLFQIDSAGKPFRLDHTQYQGTSFGATFFNFRDTLVLAGGYGFWAARGPIRFFKKKINEWDVFSINKEVSFAQGVNATTYFDPQHAKLFLIFKESKPEFVKSNSDTKLLFQVLDLNTKNWLNVPFEINQNIAKNLSDLSIISHTEYGPLVSSMIAGDAVILDLNNNKIYKLPTELSSDFIQSRNIMKDHMVYWKKGGISMYNYEKDSLAYFPLDKNELELLNIPIYIIQNQESNLFIENSKNIAIILLTIVITILIFYATRLKKLKKQIQILEDIQDPKNFTIENFKKGLDVNEINILKMLLTNAEAEKNTSIQELNKLLGLEKKPIKIQNNIRAALISNINKRFAMLESTNDLLIERVRSEFDKRFFEYSLNKKFIGLLLKNFD